jgi:subtilisin family serine protease
MGAFRRPADGYHRRIVRRPLLVLLPLALAFFAPSAGAGTPPAPGSGQVEVIVELAPPPAARAGFGRPGLHGRARDALAAIAAAQRRVEARVLAAVPEAVVRWRYRIVLDGLAVVVPASQLGRLAGISGVKTVYPSVRYGPLLDRSPDVIGAPAVWGPTLDNAGRGIKIGIIDDGIDPSHSFFDPAGYVPPPGFPKGDRSLTTAKVIVARAFPPPGRGRGNAGRAFDPVFSFHGTHVAGIAAGNPGTTSALRDDELSGVAPLAYLGNYKALTIPTDSGLGLNGNSPELVAAIEAAVADGMDVINLSLGEPEVDPERDAVARALDNAAAAGVVPVVAAGNDFLELGRGSVGSPGSAGLAITVAAVTNATAIAPFSASGPTPLGLALKPDVSAPGVNIVSSVPGDEFDFLSGTSMAAPHIAGAAALLRELHPSWTPQEVKSALVLTAMPASGAAANRVETPSTRQGGGVADLPAATAPLIFASPQSLGFGLLDVSDGPQEAELSAELTDAGQGAGSWSVSVQPPPQGGATVTAPASVEVPGTLTVKAAAGVAADEGERTGFVVLERAGIRRRLPFWFRVTSSRLDEAPFRTLLRPGLHRGNASGRGANVDAYRYPDAPILVRRRLPGPEQVFRFALGRAVANFGVAVVGRGPGVTVEPRIVRDHDENRLLGPAALPLVTNPYLASFFEPILSAAALLPEPGTYSIVFDTPSSRAAGRFTFRFWVDDTTPPRAQLLSRTARGGRILARVTDSGSGINPAAIRYSLDGGPLRTGRFDPRRDVAVLDVSRARQGRHRLLLQVSDRQEAKNNENVAEILPNTRVVETIVRIP